MHLERALLSPWCEACRVFVDFSRLRRKTNMFVREFEFGTCTSWFASCQRHHLRPRCFFFCSSWYHAERALTSCEVILSPLPKNENINASILLNVKLHTYAPVSRALVPRHLICPSRVCVCRWSCLAFFSLQGVPSDSELQRARLCLRTGRLGAREARDAGGGVGNGGLQYSQDQGEVPQPLL